jgi:adenylylsulfate kinase-like enzyme
MIVPTKEIICYKFILENAMNTQTMFYLTGIQGSGKTIML